MRGTYVFQPKEAFANQCTIADLTEMIKADGNRFWVINRINTSAQLRGKGYASKLLKDICAQADQEGVILKLDVGPSGPMNYEQLKSWYERNGFVMVADGYMCRDPKVMADG